MNWACDGLCGSPWAQAIIYHITGVVSELETQNSQKKEAVGSTAASKTCHLPHPQRQDTQVFLYFLLLLQKKAVNPYVLKWEWLWYPLHKYQDVLFGWTTHRSPSPIWPAGAVKHSGHSSTLTSKAISAAVLDDQSFSLK